MDMALARELARAVHDAHGRIAARYIENGAVLEARLPGCASTTTTTTSSYALGLLDLLDPRPADPRTLGLPGRPSTRLAAGRGPVRTGTHSRSGGQYRGRSTLRSPCRIGECPSWQRPGACTGRACSCSRLVTRQGLGVCPAKPRPARPRRSAERSDRRDTGGAPARGSVQSKRSVTTTAPRRWPTSPSTCRTRSCPGRCARCRGRPRMAMRVTAPRHAWPYGLVTPGNGRRRCDCWQRARRRSRTRSRRLPAISPRTGWMTRSTWPPPTRTCISARPH